MKFRSALPATLLLAAFCTISLPATAAQVLRNLVSIEGVRDNPLVGYGLVVGLNGSGDTTQVKFSSQSVVNMLKQFGVKLPDGAESKSKNVATVMVSAVFPPGYRRGQAIDVTVSSLGDAKSLRGGTLLLTPAARGRQRNLRPGARQRGGRRPERQRQERLVGHGQHADLGTDTERRQYRTRNHQRLFHQADRDAAICATRISRRPPISSKPSTAASAPSPPPATPPAWK